MLHYTHQHLDKSGYHVRMLLVDYSKAFDLVNHNILLTKLKDAGTPEILVRWCAAFLLERQQCVKIGSVHSPTVTLNAGTPQGTLLGPLSFVVHLGDFSPPGPVEMAIFVDDTSLYCASRDPASPHMQEAAGYTEGWAEDNDMRLSAPKTKELAFSFSRQLDIPPISIGDVEIEQVQSAKLLGVTISKDLSWNTHVHNITSKCNQRLFLLYHLRKSGVPPKDLLTVYKAMIRPVLEYACPAWHTSLPGYLHDELELIQKRALRTIFGWRPYEDNLAEAQLATAKDRRDELCHIFYTKMKAPGHRLHHLLPEPREQAYDLRRKRRLPLPKTRTKRYQNSFIPWCIRHFD